MRGRSVAKRIRDARARLEREGNAWIATAAPNGAPHLVPLSLAWIDDRVVVATPSNALTARNASGSRRARAALDGADDVVVIDANAEVIDLELVEAATIQRYIERVGWDPRDEPGAWSLIRLTPTRIQVWNGPGEIYGRTVMRDGRWVEGNHGTPAA